MGAHRAHSLLPVTSLFSPPAGGGVPLERLLCALAAAAALLLAAALARRKPASKKLEGVWGSLEAKVAAAGGSIALASYVFSPLVVFAAPCPVVVALASLGAVLSILSAVMLELKPASARAKRSLAALASGLLALPASAAPLLSLAAPSGPVYAQLLGGGSPAFLLPVFVSVALILVTPSARYELVSVYRPMRRVTEFGVFSVRVRETEIRGSGTATSGAACLLLSLSALRVPPSGFQTLLGMLLLAAWYAVTLWAFSKLRWLPYYVHVTQLCRALSFYCPRCGSRVWPYRGSGDLLKSYASGELELGDAFEAAVVAHYRHRHTNYERELRKLTSGRHAGGGGYGELRGRYTKRARWMAVHDGLLKPPAVLQARDLAEWLFVAALLGDANRVRELLARGADPNFVGDEGLAPLHAAAKHGHTEIAELLIGSGADVNIRGRGGLTPLHVAAAAGQVKVMRLLIARGADVNARDGEGWTPLHAAARYCRAEAAELLIEHGADVNARERNGGTPLHVAVAAGCAEVARLLVESGADVNAEGEGGLTPLHAAALLGNAEAAKLLIERGANVNARSRSGETPLHYAARAGSARVVELLLKSGADPRAKDARGRTPSDAAFRAAWAKRRPEVYLEIYEMLLKAERRRSG
jgi:cytohesin